MRVHADPAYLARLISLTRLLYSSATGPQRFHTGGLGQINADSVSL